MINSKNIIRKIFFAQLFLIFAIILATILRRQLMKVFPRTSYIFFNEIKQQNYFQQRYIFSYLILKKIQFSQIKIADNIFMLDGFVFLDNCTSLECLAPIVQYKIVWINEQKNKSIILDQNYYKLNSIIPKKCINHKIQIKISQKINSNFWKKVKNKKGKVIMFYKLIERYQ
jgi:hypothetical protein